MVTALLPVGAVAVFLLARIGDDPLVGADYSLLELGTRAVWRGDALLGPYSRFRWNHPGPALWYWNAPFYALPGQRAGGLSLAALVLNGAGLGWAVATVGRVAGRAAAWAAAAVVLVFVGQTGTSWLDQPWNPLLVIVPLVVAGIAVAGVVAGRRWHLVVAVAAASFAVQTHGGTAPMVVVFALIAGGALTVHLMRDRRAWGVPTLVAAGAGAVLWILPIYQQLTRQPGNLGALLDYSRGPRGDHSLGEVFDVIGADLTLVHHDLISNLLAGGGVLPPTASGLHLVAIILLLAGGVVAGLVNARGGRLFEATLCGAPLLGVAAMVVSLERLNDVLYPYLSLSVLSLGLLLQLGIALTVVAEVRARAGRWARTRTSVVAVAAIAVLALTVVGQEVRADHEAFPFARLVGDVGTERAMDAILEAVPNGEGVDVFMVDSSTWGPGAIVANRLERAGHTVTLDDRWTFMFGEQRGPSGCPGTVVTLHDIDPTRQRLEPIPASETRATVTLGEALVTVTDAPPTAACPR